jgi:hypothetical protein
MLHFIVTYGVVAVPVLIVAEFGAFVGALRAHDPAGAVSARPNQGANRFRSAKRSGQNRCSGVFQRDIFAGQTGVRFPCRAVLRGPAAAAFGVRLRGLPSTEM